MKRTGLLLLSLLLATPLASAADEGASDGRTWHRLVGILQYLQADYPAAVASKSDFELSEQRSFIAEANDAARDMGPRGEGFLSRLRDIKARVDKGEDPEGVSRDCAELVEDLVLSGGLARSPRNPPDLVRGEQIYQQACATCHGADGRAQVTIAQTMEPKPANFHDADIMAGLTPYKAFNTVSFGVTGTAMPGFPTLSEEERWAVSFYVFTLRQPACEGTPPRASLEKLANSTDPMLVEAHGQENLACLRRKMPNVDEERGLLVARDHVEQALKLGANGDWLAARNALLDAYLNGVEPVEPPLRARNPDLVLKLEKAFLDTRLAAEQKSPHLQDEGRILLSVLDEARRGSGSTAGALSVMWITLFILIREGFEASIIVAALLAMLRKMQAPAYVRVVHVGWVSALVVGAIAFAFGRHLLGGANRELLEGFAGLAAVGMLLYAALWLNARSNMSKFMGELREKMQGALGRGSMAGLFFIAFSSVLRESVETAIFLQGLALDSATGTAWGCAAGVVAIAALVIFVNRVGYKLPMKTLFKASTVLLVATAVILLGKALHALQEVALVPLKPIPFVTIDLLGIYPDAMSLGPQVVLTAIPLIMLIIKRRGGSTRLADASSQG
ncbi:cytochrome c/FTR1 family iron permease [Vitiosangium sp. GDMCC 1.1324]|uniref:cytochrome c/FTR1 family iron permease n=1 Tax=Vitiosangium sp. (strain GDMCC 1.1324) TaxID=2138576 RepID=UPI000D387F94|nr:cytochrome c/FTR1 family iron permease [Vitiosangium sp. GDMCC 1.1324]PTL83840.1 cytochrome C [Vitiosangium sp. GDMCC 1.1324]